MSKRTRNVVWILAACLVLAVAVGGWRYWQQHAFIESAKAAVTRDLANPASAQYRDIVTDGEFVCGQINAKNQAGAYTGFREFHYGASTDGDRPYTWISDEPVAQSGSSCGAR